MMQTNSAPNKTTLLGWIYEVSFAVNDLHLYLDTHPDDYEALKCCQEHMERRRKLLKQYAENYGPLTMDSYSSCDKKTWLWEQQPFPWEVNGGCK